MENKDPFEDYIRETEPGKKEKSYAWYTAIGLQAVDGLEPSDYLKSTAVRNIEGDISLEKASTLIETYYKENPSLSKEDRTEEADKVSLRIASILSDHSFSFTPTEYLSIHRKLFSDIYTHAGSIRNYNISKKEWVLDGASVLYGSASELRATLEYDFSEERKFSYSNLSMDEIIKHLARFVSMLWQIHVFEEGNTRTTAVFFIKYLKTLGFDVTNDIFAKNAWYFLNALVRANYNDFQNGVFKTTEYLELFLRNLLLKEKNVLSNRAMHISGLFKTIKPDIGEAKPDIGEAKPDIGGVKPDIEGVKPDIEGLLSPKTLSNIKKLNEAYLGLFSRSDVMALLSLKQSRASELLKQMMDLGIIESVKGKGKGKYRFK